ncbi:Small heat shock protein, chloroplastic [Linum perenne]
MSQILSNLGLSMPPSMKNPSSSRLCISAMAPDGSRANLDHLQRAKINKTQQPRRRVVSSAPIGLYDRHPAAKTVQQMMEAMDQLIEDNNNRSFAHSSFDERRNYRAPWEIKERETEYRIRFDMPGMSKQDVKIWVEDTMLVVKAEKKNEEDEEEWEYGKYGYRIALPENVEIEKIKAEVRDGVLCLSVPKVSGKGKVFDISVD